MASVLSAKLGRTDSNTPWGFRLHGGKDFSAPLTIQRVSTYSTCLACYTYETLYTIKTAESASTFKQVLTNEM